MAKVDWKPVDTLPEEGKFIVFLEEELLGTRVHAMNKHKNMATVGTLFSYDAPKVLYWDYEPEGPEDG